jgi:hypothetical protein
VREVQVKENKRFATECQNHGCDGKGIAAASSEVNKKTYTVTPSGKPETWTEEEQQRQAIAKRKASDDIVAIGPQGTREVVKVAGDAAKEARQLVNHHGVDAIWDFFFGKKTGPVEEPTIESSDETEEPEFLTRAEQIRREQAALKESLKSNGGGGGSDAIDADPPVEKTFKPFFFF